MEISIVLIRPLTTDFKGCLNGVMVVNQIRRCDYNKYTVLTCTFTRNRRESRNKLESYAVLNFPWFFLQRLLQVNPFDPYAYHNMTDPLAS